MSQHYYKKKHFQGIIYDGFFWFVVLNSITDTIDMDKQTGLDTEALSEFRQSSPVLFQSMLSPG